MGLYEHIFKKFCDQISSSQKFLQEYIRVAHIKERQRIIRKAEEEKVNGFKGK